MSNKLSPMQELGVNVVQHIIVYYREHNVHEITKEIQTAAKRFIPKDTESLNALVLEHPELCMSRPRRDWNPKDFGFFNVIAANLNDMVITLMVEALPPIVLGFLSGDVEDAYRGGRSVMATKQMLDTCDTNEVINSFAENILKEVEAKSDEISDSAFKE